MSGWTDGRTRQRTTGRERGRESIRRPHGEATATSNERSEVITESERALPPSLPFLGTKLLRFRQAPPLQEEAVALPPFVRPPPSLTADFLPLRFDYVCLGLVHSGGGGNEDDNGQFKPLSLLSFERSSRSRYRTKYPFKMPGMRLFRFQCGLKQNEQSTKDRGRVTRAFWDVDLCSTGAKPTIAQN